MENQQPEDPLNALLAEFNTRLNELEEKQRLIKDRTLLIGENLISTKEEFSKQSSDTNNQLKQIRYELDSLKKIITRILEETDEFARKSELEILQRQAKIFQPLEFARIQDVEKIVEEKINKLNRSKDIKNKDAI